MTLIETFKKNEDLINEMIKMKSFHSETSTLYFNQLPESIQNDFISCDEFIKSKVRFVDTPYFSIDINGELSIII